MARLPARKGRKATTESAAQAAAPSDRARLDDPTVRRACVIGAGLGGLALAIRLQTAGVATTLIEARDRAGGCAYAWERAGFTFDAGPTAFADPDALRELWALSGHDMAEDVELLEVAPLCRYAWPDGSQFDLSASDAALRAEVARIAPTDLAGFEELLDYAGAVLKEGYARLAHHPLDDVGAAVGAAPALVRLRAWRSVHAAIGSYVKSDKLREALSFEVLRAGGNPFSASALHTYALRLEQDTGLWCAAGGTNKLVAGLVRQYERLGGKVMLHDPALRIHTLGNRAHEVETASGWKQRFDAVASNADVVHSYRDLLSGTPRGREVARKLARQHFSPGLFVVHFALEGSWPGIPHRSVLFGPRFRGLFADIFDHGVLPRDMAIMLSHASLTDPSLAPPGKSVFQAAVPVANLGKLPIDWDTVGPMLEERVLAEIGRRLVPDIDDRIVTKFHYSPRDFSLDLSAWQGAAWGLEPSLLQSGPLRPHHRDGEIANLYLVGASTHPGAGVPGVLSGARITAGMMLEDMK